MKNDTTKNNVIAYTDIVKNDITVDSPIDNPINNDGDDDSTIKEIKNRRIQMIKFGEEFETWDTAHQIQYLKKLASSMNQAADMMQNERNAIAVERNTAIQQLKNAEENLAIQKSIVFKVITDANTAKDEYITRIQALEYRVKTQETVIETLNKELGNIQ